MKLDRSGIILFVSNYPVCVHFYEEILELPILFKNEDLTCFEFGGSYLMVEPADLKVSDKSNNCLRFNVVDVHKSAAILEEKGIPVKIEVYDWGVVGRFHPNYGLELRNEALRFKKY